MTSVELHTILTSDGYPMDAAYWPATGRAARADACVFIHGATSHAFTPFVRAVGKGLAGMGVSMLALNSRGHDIVHQWARPDGTLVQAGTAYEDVGQATLDFAAGFAWLRARGHERILAGGHSLGAVKSLVASANAAPDGLVGVLPLSPPRLAYSAYLESPLRDPFLKNFARAEALVAEGKGQQLMVVGVPIPGHFTADQYVQKYGPAEPFDIKQLLPRINVPVHAVYGSQELVDMAQIGASEQVARAYASDHPQVTVELVEGADHRYTGRVPALLDAIRPWLEVS